MHQGSCHCGCVAFEVEGDPQQLMECNCSHCSRKGCLLWFVPRAQLHFLSTEDELGSYTFNKHVIRHHFCTTCGCAPFGFGKDASGATRERRVHSACDTLVSGKKRVCCFDPSGVYSKALGAPQASDSP